VCALMERSGARLADCAEQAAKVVSPSQQQHEWHRFGQSQYNNTTAATIAAPEPYASCSDAVVTLQRKAQSDCAKSSRVPSQR